jgi:hypothetical protein
LLLLQMCLSMAITKITSTLQITRRYYSCRVETRSVQQSKLTASQTKRFCPRKMIFSTGSLRALGRMQYLLKNCQF